MLDRTGEWWRGEDPDDLGEYLAAATEAGYPVARVVHAVCGDCGGIVFTVRVDDEPGYAERCCVACGRTRQLLDSADVADDADPTPARCPDGHDAFNLAVGYALREDGEVRWVYVALRCTTDGTVGVYTDWKIDYSPTDELLAGA